MPRQPLLERYHQGPWSMGASAREERPELVLIIGQCLTYWPDIELFMALLLGVMLKANTDAAVAVYLAITAGPARRAALKAAADSVLSEAERELFAAIQIVHKGIETQRNDLAHGCYGSIRAIPDALLWVETKHMTNWTISVWNKDANNTRTGFEHDELARHMFVYKKTDLEAIFEEMQAIWKIIFDFVGYLRRPLQPSIAETAGEIFLRLCSEPRICLALEQLRNQKKNS